ncbi:MAG: hypothetical protein AABY22_32280, partial [Nanoarchaeota archaeon]
WLNNVYILLDKSEWFKPEVISELWSVQRSNKAKSTAHQRPIEGLPTQKKDYPIPDILRNISVPTIEDLLNIHLEEKSSELILTNWAATTKLLKKVLKFTTPEVLKESYRKYLNSPDYERLGGSLKVFLSDSVINKFLKSSYFRIVGNHKFKTIEELEEASKSGTIKWDRAEKKWFATD